jgi:hypothetical protein
MRSTDNHQPPVAAAPHLADGVEYRTIPGAPAPSFGCARYRAKLLTTACAKRWRHAQTARGYAADQIEKCRSCPIGASHSGQAVVRYSTLYDSPICPRCGRGSARRLVGGRRCISCFNREREFVLGRNRKNTKPVHAIPLHRRTVRYAVEGGGVQDLTIPHSRDLTELMMSALRNERGRPFFFYTGQTPVRMGEVA